MFRSIDEKHPIFQLNMRRVRWWHGKKSAWYYAAYIAAWVMLALLFAWTLFVIGRYIFFVRVHPVSSLNMSNLYLPTWRISSQVAYVTFVVGGGVSVGLSYLLDFLLMAFTVNSINGERSAYRWDLIRLTPLPLSTVLDALYAAGQFRVWRMTMIVVASRLSIFVAMILNLAVLEPVLQNTNFWNDFINAVFYDASLEALLALAAVGITTVVAVVEPIWRMRATTAIAMVISARVDRFIVAMSLAFPVLVALWLSQAVIIGLFIWTLISVGRNISGPLLGMFTIWFFACCAAAIIYFYFRVLRSQALDWALRLIHREGRY